MVDGSKNRIGFWGTLFFGAILLFKEGITWAVGRVLDWMSLRLPSWVSTPMTSIYEDVDLWNLFGISLIIIAIWGSYRVEIKTTVSRWRWAEFPGVKIHLAAPLSLMRNGDWPVQVTGLAIALENRKNSAIRSVRGHVEFEGVSEQVDIELAV